MPRTIRARLALALAALVALSMAGGVVAVLRLDEGVEKLRRVVDGNLVTVQDARGLDGAVAGFSLVLEEVAVSPDLNAFVTGTVRLRESWLGVRAAADRLLAADAVRANAATPGDGLLTLMDDLDAQVEDLDFALWRKLVEESQAAREFDRAAGDIALMRARVETINEDAGFALGLTFLDLMNARAIPEEELRAVLEGDYASFQYSLEAALKLARLDTLIARLPGLTATASIVEAQHEFVALTQGLGRDIATMEDAWSGGFDGLLGRLALWGDGERSVFRRQLSVLEARADARAATDRLSALTDLRNVARTYYAGTVSTTGDAVGDIIAAEQQSIVLTLSLLAAAAALGAAISRRLVFAGIVLPLERIEWAVGRLSKGDVEIAIPRPGAEELARIAGALDILRGYVRRVTEAEARLRFTQRAVDQAAEPVLWMDKARGELVYANAAASRMLGWPRDALVGKSPRDFDLDFDSRDRRGLMDELAAGGRLSFESRYRTRLGALLDVELTIAQANDGRRDIVLANIKDVTERKRAAEALAAKQAQLESALASMSDGFFMTDGEGRFVLVNQRFRDFVQTVGGPGELAVEGESLSTFSMRCAEMGMYGTGDSETLWARRMAFYHDPEERVLDLMNVSERQYQMRKAATPDGGIVVTVSDITEITRAQIEVHRKERQLRSALSSMTHALYMLDSDLRIELSNGGFETLMADLEVPPALHRAGAPWRDLVAHIGERGGLGDGDLDTSIEGWMRAHGPVGPVRERFQTLDGRWMEFRKDDRAEGGCVVTMTDVTEEKVRADALAESEARTRLILESVDQGIFGLDTDGRVSFVNDRACALLGYGADALEGGDILALIQHSRLDGSAYPPAQSPIRRVLATGEAARADDEVFWTADGEPLSVEYHATPMSRDGRLVGAVVAFRDVSEFLAMSRNFVALLENTDDFIYIKDARKRFVAVSQTIARIAGYASWRGLIGLTSEQAFGENHAAIYSREDDDILSGKLALLAQEKPLFGGDGSRGWQNVKKYPITDRAGRIVGLCGISRDVTEKVEAERRTRDALRTVSESIAYASRIQRAILPRPCTIERTFAEHYLIWEPRDEVGGDIYWCRDWGDGRLVLVGDCTGHGVPGAFMTMLTAGTLQQALSEVEPGRPGLLIARLHRLVQATLGETEADALSDDGLELGVCYLDARRESAVYAGARFSLFLLDHVQGDVSEIRGARSGVGYRALAGDLDFPETPLPLDPDISFHLVSDGLVDQVGGDRRRSFGRSRYREVLERSYHRPLREVGAALRDTLAAFQGVEPRRDDVTALGFKPKGDR